MKLLKKAISLLLSVAMLSSGIVGLASETEHAAFKGTSPDIDENTFRNPMLLTDVADPDCVAGTDKEGNKAYYVVSTAMSYSPGAPIMRSYDLVNWENVSYVYDSLDYSSDALSLRNNQHAFGKGQWAASMRYHEGTHRYYVLFSSYTTGKTYIYSAENPEDRQWNKTVIDGAWHDPSLYVDADGQMYALFGSGEVNCLRLLPDEDGYVTVDPSFETQKLITDMGAYLGNYINNYTPDGDHFIIKGEGSHAYCVDGKMYIIMISWPKEDIWKRIMVCYQADSLQDAIENGFKGKIILDDTVGYAGGEGVAQGGIMNTTGAANSSDGDWKGIIYQDRGPAGRCPFLLDVNWETDNDGLKWPMLSTAQTMEKPIKGKPSTSIVVSDEFDNGTERNVYPARTKTEPTAKIASFSAEGVKVAARELKIEDSIVDNPYCDGNVGEGPWYWGTEPEKTGTVTVMQDENNENKYMHITGREAVEDGIFEWCNAPDNGGADKRPLNGTTYDISFKARYSSSSANAPAKEIFALKFNGATLASGEVQPDTWTTITGKYTFGENEVGQYNSYKLVTENSTVDFDIDDVIVTEEQIEGEEIVDNGGMESIDGNNLPYYWGATDGGATAQADTDAYKGNYSLKIANRKNAGDAARQYIGLTPGFEYAFSAWVKCSEADTFKATLLTNYWMESTMASGDVKAGEWTRIKGIFTAPSDWQNGCFIIQSENTTADFLVDDVSIKELPGQILETPKEGENDYNGSNLNLAWQWTHVPDNTCWSLTDRDGWLRITTNKPTKNIQIARNVLTQRCYGPTSAGTIKMDVSHMKNGDYAGLTTMQTRYGNIGIKMMDNKKYFVYQYIKEDAYNGEITDDNWLKLTPQEEILGELHGDEAYVKLEYFIGNFDNKKEDGTAYFHYSENGKDWKYAGGLDRLDYDLKQFTGYKFGLFNYASEEVGGYVDYDYFHVEDDIIGDGSTIDAVASISNDVVDVSVLNNTMTTQSADIYVAAYKNGVLSKLEIEKDKSVNAKDKANVSKDMSGIDYDKIYVYLWKAGTMTPLTDKIEAKGIETYALYTFNESNTEGGVRSVIKDRSGNGHDASLKGMAKYKTDTNRESKVLYTNGSKDTYMEFPIPKGANNKALESFTVSMDMKNLTGGNYFNFCVGDGSVDGNGHHYLGFKMAEDILLSTVQNQFSEKKVTLEGKGKQNVWTHVDFVIDNGTSTIYVDGEKAGSLEGYTMADIHASVGSLSFSPWSADPSAKCYYDNVAIYDKAFTDAEIKALPKVNDPEDNYGEADENFTDYKITADKGVDIQDGMIGLFFEDINYAADGGLYAEMIENRSFEALKSTGWKFTEYDGLYAWSAYPASGNGAELKIKDVGGLNANNTHYAEFKASATQTGLKNAAYDGVLVKQGEKYNVSLYAKSDSYRGGINVSVYDKNGEKAATAQVTDSVTNGWQKYTVEMTATKDARKADFVVELDGEGTVSLDMVSCIPQNSVEGIFRKDLAEKLKAINPGFLRFPGGCIIEGCGLENRYNWKDTIGDVSERKQNWNLWADYTDDCKHYNQTYGLGFYEFFKLCEYLECKPVPVVNAGMGCQYRTGDVVPINSEDFQQYIQDALDLIEFANSTDTEQGYGKVRADMGHPEPFNLKIIGIGNEQWQTEDNEWFMRYEKFEEAIHNKYPDIKLVATAGPNVQDPGYDQAWSWIRGKAQTNPNFAYVVDEHYYREPSWFYGNINFYDDYSRDIKVFAGEYASRWYNAPNSPNLNTWEAALSEASYLTMVERNADVVYMASYAPLFARLNYTQWSPDMIWFDDASSYGSPTYYVQKLFSNNMGDYTLESSLKDYGAETGVYSVASYDSETRDIIIKIANSNDMAQVIPIELDNSFELTGTATASYIEANPADFNSIENGDKVSDKETELTGITNKYNYTVPASSFTVLRIRTTAANIAE